MSFIYRPSSRGDDHGGSLSLRFIHRRKVKQLTTLFKLYPREWDTLQQQLIHRNSDRESYLRQVEDYLQRSKLLFEQTIHSLEKKGSYELEEIVCHFRFDSSDISLLSFVRRLSGEMMRFGQERTARAYRTAAYGLVEFNNGKDLPLLHINRFLIKSYERALKEKGRTLNTISFYMRNLRAIYNKAIQEGYFASDPVSPFREVYTGVEKAPTRAFSSEEIQRLHDLEFSRCLNSNKKVFNSGSPSLYRSWRLFFFCFYARGMSFVDMAYLRKSNIQGDLIRYYRKKTGQLIEVKITPKLQLLIDSFTQEVKHSSYLFPIIHDSNKSKRLYYESGLRQQNKCLKILAAKAGINRSLSTHVSQHSWAMMAKKEPMWIVNESQGHCNEKTTYIYLASLDNFTLNRANYIVSATIDMNVADDYFQPTKG